MSKQEIKTKVFIEEFKGNKMFAIHKVDDNGEKIENYSLVINFGKAKALEISKHAEELNDFVIDQFAN